MQNRWVKAAFLTALVVMTTALGGCYVVPIGYYPRYVYAPYRGPVVPGYYGYYR